VAFSPDGTRLATAADDGTIKVWDAATGKELLHCAGQYRAIVALTFLAGGKQLATLTGVRLWTALTGREQVTVWDTATGKELNKFVVPSYYAGQVAFSADGRRLAGVDHGGNLAMWDVATGKQLMTGTAQPGVCFSPDGRLLATCAEGGGILLWETSTRKVRLRLAAGQDVGGKLAFSLDGRYLAVAGTHTIEQPGGGTRNEDVLIVWDIGLGQEVLTARSPTFRSECLAFGRGPDGVARGGYGAVHLGKD
jgi:WD40 repeat protein